MKLLLSSYALEEVGCVVKRLVQARIPCGVCKDPINSYWSVWIQQDVDYPLALRIFTHHAEPRPLPPWACVLDPDLAASRGAVVQAITGTETKSSGPSERSAAELSRGPPPNRHKAPKQRELQESSVLVSSP